MRWPVVTYSRLIAESEACTACDLRHKRLLKRPENCRIKGNINAKGERIYHVLGQTDEESLDQLQSTYIAALLKIGETVRGLRASSPTRAISSPPTLA